MYKTLSTKMNVDILVMNVGNIQLIFIISQFLIMESNKQVTFKSRNYFLPGTYLYMFKQQLKYNGVATLITTTLLAPLERWRIIAQTQKSFPLRMKKFKGFFDYVSRIPKEQGLTAFWRGNTPTFWIYFYQAIFQIGIYDSIKKLGSDLNTELSQFPYAIPIFDRFLFPLFASYFTLVLVHPIDTYRIHKSMSYHKQKSDAIATKFRYRIHQTGGIKQLYKGFYLANLIGLINFNFYKSLYNTIEKIEVSGVPQDILNTELVISLLSVGLAHPLDTLKKVYQLNNLHKPPLFTNLKGVINYLKNNKIELSLYNGFLPSIVKTALYIPVFWQVLKLWRNMVDGKQISSKFGF